jgi:hypothetical protein
VRRKRERIAPAVDLAAGLVVLDPLDGKKRFSTRATRHEPENDATATQLSKVS